MTFSYPRLPLYDESRPVPRFPPQQRSTHRLGLGRHYESDSAETVPTRAPEFDGPRHYNQTGQRRRSETDRSQLEQHQGLFT